VATALAPATSQLTYLSFPVEKFERTDDGDLLVYGKATDGSLDSDDQVVDPDWSGKALNDWLSSGGNVRVQHQALRDPAGKGLSVEVTGDGHYVKSLVVEPVAKQLVEKGVLRAYSIGVARPVIKRDPTGKARGGIVCGGELAEISLVDRPANKNCQLTIAKSADGGVELVGELSGDVNALLTKALGDDPRGGLGSAEEMRHQGQAPDNTGDAAAAAARQQEGDEADQRREYEGERARWLTGEPALKGALTGTELLQQRAAWRRWNHEGDEAGLNGTADGYRLWLAKRKMDPNVGGGTDRDKIPAEDFAGKDRSFPIVTPKDVHDASLSIGRAGDDNYSSDQLKSNIISIARRKGPSFVAELPESWKTADVTGDLTKDDGDGAGKDCPTCKGDGKIMDGNRQCPDCGGSGVATPDDTKATPAADMAKAGARSCTGCGKNYHADSSETYCGNCGKKLPAAKTTSSDNSITPKSEGLVAALAAYTDSISKAVTAGIIPQAQAAAMLAEAHAAVKNDTPLPGDTSPAGSHREPDGTSTVEPLEADAGMATDPDPVPDQVPASVQMAAVPYGLRRMHDACCAAYPAEAVLGHYPALKTVTDAVDDSWFTTAAAAAAVAGKSKKTIRLTLLADAARTVKAMDQAAVADGRALLAKAFTDMYPNERLSPADAPRPGSYQRPYLSAGHASQDAGHSGGGNVPTASHVPDPGDFTRGPLTEGHAAPSPATDNLNRGMPDTSTAAARTYYSNTAKDQARQALQAMHDHIAGTFPDICPMANSKSVMPPDLGARNVPQAAAPASVKTPDSTDLIKQAARLGYVLTPATAVQPTPLEPVTGEFRGIDPATLKTMLAEQAADITTAWQDRLAGLQAQVDKLGSQPDPNLAPVRGALARADSGAGVPVERRSLIDEATDQARKARAAEEAEYRRYITALSKSHDPGVREKALAVLDKMLTLPAAG
jgi:hypothetical protein